MIVRSDEPISAMGNSQLGGNSQDVFLFNVLWDTSTEFMVVSREPTERNALFSIIAAHDSTTVEIWKPSASAFENWKTLTLNRLETFTFKEKYDPTGYRILSNKAVSVLSGSQTDVIFPGMNGWDHMCVALAPVTCHQGVNDYYIIPITIRNNPGAYHVRVVAIHNATIVSDLKDFYYVIAELHAGQYHENGPVSSGTPVTALRCSKPCIVMQYNVGPAYDNTANIDTFQMWIPSVQYSVNYVNFITPHNENDGAMQNTLAILTWSAVVNEIFVDGAPVSGWNNFWTGSETAYATVSVSDGEHNVIYLGDPQYGFLAWLYGKHGSDTDAFGTLLGVETGECFW